MKLRFIVLVSILLLAAVGNLTAGEIVLYGGSQELGDISFSDASQALSPFKVFDMDFSGSFGARFSTGRVIGFEQSIGFSPRFAQPGVRAFQMDSNLIVQAPGRIAPYVTGGIGFIHSWNSDDDPVDLADPELDPEQLAKFVFGFGTNFSINYGGGIKIRRILGPLGFNIDVRGYTLPGVHDSNLNFVQTTAGAVISW